MRSVIGYDLDRALALLADDGATVARIDETAPPRTPLAGARRVVRQRLDPIGAVELVVCRERYVDERPGPGAAPRRPER